MRVMLGADTFSMSASSRGVRCASANRTSTENWCGASDDTLSKRTRREIRMHTSRSWVASSLTSRFGSDTDT